MKDFHPLAVTAGGAITPINSFLLVMMFSFLLCLIVGIGHDENAEFFTANRSLSMLQNMLALCGDYIPTPVLLSAVGAVALGGYDGMVIALSAIASLIVLLILAEPLRNTEQYTLGGVLEDRVSGAAIRVAGAVATLSVCLPLAVIQLTVAGDVTAYVLGLQTAGVSQICTVLIGLMIILYAVFGGMRGTSMIQVGKTLLVSIAFLVLTYTVLRRFNWSLGDIAQSAAIQGGGPEVFYSSGLLYGETMTGRIDFFSLCFTIALGSAILPHIIMRISVFKSGSTARRATKSVMMIVTLLFIGMVITGLGAAALVGNGRIFASNPLGYSAIFMLVDSLGSSILFTLVCCVVFVAALSTLSGITLAAGASLAHDFYAQAILRGRAGETREVALARWNIVAFGVLSVFLAVSLHRWSVSAMTSFAIAVAASTVLPALVFSLFWNGFTKAGLLWTIYGGLTCCVILQVFSASVSGRPDSLLPDRDFHWFPLENIGLAAVPIGFLLGWAGSWARRKPTWTQTTALGSQRQSET